MFTDVRADLQATLDEIKAAGLWKGERVITTPQRAEIGVSTGPDVLNQAVLNLCANNYLGLADHPTLIAAAKEALDRWGFGMASVRFICGTQEVHKTLEARISEFLGMEDTILYGSCFDANGGLFETLLGEDDAVISDALNHASIIDGVRLCKARRFRYANRDMDELRTRLQEARDGGAKRVLIATDGVFSMDGYVAPLAEICDLADEYGAMVMVDDSHAVGFVGESGRGTHELAGVMDRVDIITGTLGKALGGASGGYTSARREVVELLRQRSRPYLFSNSVAPTIAATSIAVLDLLEGPEGATRRAQLRENTAWFREQIVALGYDVLAGDHPIVPVMIGDAALAGRTADALLQHGVYVIGFSYPVVPMGAARIRTQISAGLTRAELEKAIAAFAAVKESIGG